MQDFTGVGKNKSLQTKDYNKKETINHRTRNSVSVSAGSLKAAAPKSRAEAWRDRCR